MTDEHEWTLGDLICTILQWTCLTLVTISIFGFYIAFYIIIGIIDTQEDKRHNITG